MIAFLFDCLATAGKTVIGCGLLALVMVILGPAIAEIYNFFDRRSW